ncbi:2-hydroxymuconate tautomerase [Paracoccaceae bacterium GXU_MW_L88]
MRRKTMPIIRIDISEGRTHEQKAAISRDITESVSKHTGLAAEKVMIFWTDLPRHNQCVGGEMRATPPAD